jgi:ATP-dependent Clp protease protease subunit
MTKQDTNDNDNQPLSHSEALQNYAGRYVFMDDVTAESVKPVIEWILYENYISKIHKPELLLMICSEGGDLSAAFALIDTMKSSKIPIKTVGLGLIASCGLLIFIAGQKGRRFLTPNTSILSHQFSAGSEGKSHELFATMREFELTNKRILDHYKVCTGLDEDIIMSQLLPAQDVWLDHDAALKLNLCDYIEGVSPPPSTRKRTTTKV